MAEGKVRFDLVAPERRLASETADMVTAPGVEGEFGVLPDHSPMLVQLRPGTIRVYRDGEVAERYFVAGGFAQIDENGLIVLADEEANNVREIDPERAKLEVEEWLKRFTFAKEGEVEEYQRRLEVARARLESTEAAIA